MTSLWVLRAFFVTITYLLITSALRTRVIQDGKLLIFNSKTGNPSAILRRSLGGLSATLFYSSTHLSPTYILIPLSHSHIRTLKKKIVIQEKKRIFANYKS